MEFGHFGDLGFWGVGCVVVLEVWSFGVLVFGTFGGWHFGTFVDLEVWGCELLKFWCS